MMKWWNENGWKIRCKIYSIILFPTYIIEIVIFLLEMILKIYDSLAKWILWNLLNFLFKYRGGNEE